MDFARKQLEKYGWTDGKGLGKHENGISQALKPKLKRSVAGVGYDAATDFTEHWWSALYDKAANNVEVKEKNGKTKKIKTKDDSEFEITNSTWKIHKKSKKKDEPSEEYSDFFVRTDILTGGKVKSKKVKKESDDEGECKDVLKLTDEQLFAACEGRTAHKGARHGLKALGKLARIEQQEQMLLSQARFNGYSHSKNINSNIDSQVFEDINLNSDCDSKLVSKKKKKKKRCNSDNIQKGDQTNENEKEVEDNVAKNKKDKALKCVSDISLKEDGLMENNLNENRNNKLEQKGRKDKSKDILMEVEDVNNDVKETKEKSKKKKKKPTALEDSDEISDHNSSGPKKRKKN